MESLFRRMCASKIQTISDDGRGQTQRSAHVILPGGLGNPPGILFSFNGISLHDWSIRVCMGARYRLFVECRELYGFQALRQPVLSVPAAVITPFPAGPWSFRNAGRINKP